MRYRTHWLAVAAASLLLASTGSWAQVAIGISVRIAPPVLPVYVQPPMPALGYIWVPGYWAYDDAGYYWVPGTWVLPPRVGLLWTPGYWGWDDGAYIWHEGYWASEVGFYGGVDYGFGYDGAGYWGGYWRGGVFYYNSAVTRVRPGFPLPHVYSHVVADHERERVSFNGGERGTQARPTAAQLHIDRGPHTVAVAAQRNQVQTASHEGSLRDSFNHGRPAIAATSRAGEFRGSGVVGVHTHPTAAPALSGRGAPESRGEIAHGPAQRGSRPAPQAQPQAHSQPQERTRTPQGEQFGPRGGEPQPQSPPSRGFTPQPHIGVPHQTPRQAQPEQRQQPEQHQQPEQRQGPQHQAPEHHNGNGREPPHEQH